MQATGFSKVSALASTRGAGVATTVRSGRQQQQASLARLARRSQRAVAARAVDEDEEAAKGMMADIGLGDLEEVMEKAGGGSASPDFVPEDLDGVFAFLGSENVDLAQKLLVEKYGENLYRELGFTSQSETINGRLAMIGFLAGFGAIFTGDVITQFAKAPLPAVLVSLAVITATVIPTVRPEGYIPEGVKSTVMKLYDDAGLSDVFTPKAEMINGRAAMVGIGALTLLAIIF